MVTSNENVIFINLSSVKKERLLIEGVFPPQPPFSPLEIVLCSVSLLICIWGLDDPGCQIKNCLKSDMSHFQKEKTNVLSTIFLVG